MHVQIHFVIWVIEHVPLGYWVQGAFESHCSRLPGKLMVFTWVQKHNEFIDLLIAVLLRDWCLAPFWVFCSAFEVLEWILCSLVVIFISNLPITWFLITTKGLKNFHANKYTLTLLQVMLCQPFSFFYWITGNFDSIFLHYSGVDATSRLKQLGMEFTVWVFKHVSSEQ